MGFRKFDTVRLRGCRVTAAEAPAPQRACARILAVTAEVNERCAALVSWANRVAARGLKPVQHAAQVRQDVFRGSNQILWGRQFDHDCKPIVAATPCDVRSHRLRLAMLQRRSSFLRSASPWPPQFCGINAIAIGAFLATRPHGARQAPGKRVELPNYVASTAAEAAGGGPIAFVQEGFSGSLNGGLLDLKAPESASVRRRNVRTAPKKYTMSASLLKHARASAPSQLEVSDRGANAEAVGHAA